MGDAERVDAQVWRPLILGRVLLVLLGTGWLGIATTLVTDPTALPSGFDIELVGILVLALLVAACCISIAFSYISVERDRLVIRNFWPRPRHVPFSTIRAVGIGYQGLEVRIRGRRWTSYGWAVQQSNLRSAAGRPGRSERLLKLIKDRAPHIHVPQLDRP